MKKTQIVLVIGVFFVFATAQAQKRYLEGEEVPQEIVNYVAENFTESCIKKVKEESDPLKTEYEVKLTAPKTELEFDKDFKIIEIESKRGVPTETLPKKVQQYLTENYPSVRVKEWKRKPEGQKVKLMNRTKLYFDHRDNYVGKK